MIANQEKGKSPMGDKFPAPRVCRKTFTAKDGTKRLVLAIFAGSKQLGLVEFEHGRSLVDSVHDLVDAYERDLREANGDTQ